MNRIIKNISRWFAELAKVWRREFRLVFTDIGVLIFFYALPLLYPIVYTLIYNPEVAKKMAVVVVDDCATARSRDFIRMASQTEAIDVIGRAANMQEARTAMNSHDCFAILHIPSDFDSNLSQNRQATVPFYCDMSLLLRFRQFTIALTDLQMATGAQIAAQSIAEAGLPGQALAPIANAVAVDQVFLGDPTQGFASFIMPGLLVLIIQQSLVLGVTMIAGGHNERRRRNRGYDPLWVSASPSAIAIGKMLCHLVIYLPLLIYTLHFVPWMFNLPHYGDFFEGFLLMIPLIIASSMMAQTLSVLVTEREASLLVVVFTSVIFLFLSGLTWPRYAMNPLWHAIGNLIPATWGVEAFVRINSDSGTLAQQAPDYHMLWILAGGYFITAWIVQRFSNNEQSRPGVVVNSERVTIP